MKKICLLLVLALMLSSPVVAAAEQQERYITRAEFIKEVMIQTDTAIQESSESSFSDVTEPEFIPYIEAAYKEGIISGYDSYFEPNRSITKAEAVKIIVGLFGEKADFNRKVEEFMDDDPGFTDTEDMAPWARPYIAYAVGIGLITEEADAFLSGTPLTYDMADAMIMKARGVYQESFTRGGLSAPDMLVHVNEKQTAFETYKQKGTLFAKINFLIEGLSQEQIEKNEELKTFISDISEIDMEIDMEVSVQNPDKIYTRQSIITKDGTPETDQDTEIFAETFIDEQFMYTKMADTDKWIMRDISSFMEQIKLMSEREPHQAAQLSDDELIMFKKLAGYGDNVTIDGKEYYLIELDIDKDAFKEYYGKIMDELMDSITAFQAEDPQLSESPGFDPQQYRQMMMNLISGMDMEISYKYYINSETLLIERVWLSQRIILSMDQVLEDFVSTLDEDIPSFALKLLSETEGELEIYDIDVEVEFPVITEGDIIEQTDLLMMDMEVNAED